MTEEQLAWLADRVPRIPARPADEVRPFWSVVIPTHNRPDLLRIALASVLDQGIGAGEMEIVVMDDASAGPQTEAAVRDLGRGRVTYVRQPVNAGQVPTVNDGIARARGRWIHVLHDDDFVMPGFYRELAEALADHPTAGAALSALTLVDAAGGETLQWPKEREDTGLLENWLWNVSTSARVQPPAVVVRRDVYEVLGAYISDFSTCADCEMWSRIAAHYDWLYHPAAHACYRETGVSITRNMKRTGKNIAEIRTMIAFVADYLPEAMREPLHRAATRFWAEFALRTAYRMIKREDYEGAANQLRECLQTAPTKDAVLAIVNMSKHL